MRILSKIKKLFKPSKYSKKIFIENWGFENRGDQLMIQSVMEQIRNIDLTTEEGKNELEKLTAQILDIWQ